MTPRTRKVIGWGSVLAAIAVTASCLVVVARQTELPPTPQPGRMLAAAPEKAIPCGAASGVALSTWLSSAALNNQTVPLSQGACYLTNGGVTIDGASNLTIAGNGATFSKTALDTLTGGVDNANPLLTIINSSNVTISNLNLVGPCSSCGQRGVSYEASFGILFEEDSNITLSNVHVSHVQGDFLNFQVNNPTLTGNSTNSLSTNIRIGGMVASDAGYHGITIEAVNGLVISASSFAGMPVDVVDSEYDGGSTVFTGGQHPTLAAEDNITFEDDHFSNWGSGSGGQFYVSIQPDGNCAGMMMPPCVITGGGVQEQHVTITGNTLTDALSNAPSLILVHGTSPALTTSKFTYQDFTISHNTMKTQFVGITSGSPANCNPETLPYIAPGDPGFPGCPIGPTAFFQGVTGVNIHDNTFPVADTSGGFPTPNPYVSTVQAVRVYGLSIQNNNWTGAWGPASMGGSGSQLDPGTSAATTGVFTCNNTYWKATSPRIDTTC